MTASTSPAARMPCPEATLGRPKAPKSGANPCLARNSRAQKPYTTLGIAASNSSRNAHTFRSRAGASSERYAAAPMPSGTAMTIAIADVISVPYTNTNAPNDSRSGYQSVLVNNWYLLGFVRTGHDCTTSTTARPATTVRTNHAASWHTHRNVKSPEIGTIPRDFGCSWMPVVIPASPGAAARRLAFGIHPAAVRTQVRRRIVDRPSPPTSETQ